MFPQLKRLTAHLNTRVDKDALVFHHCHLQASVFKDLKRKIRPFLDSSGLLTSFKRQMRVSHALFAVRDICGMNGNVALIFGIFFNVSPIPSLINLSL